ncbi:helix-turn-helix domain-containing protein [Lacipirellula parvula]|uniref:Helix-turn-helix domain-containing protein n=1 Tax=Lacipirellula parvula TaxID=2650471 RepID=A0A5K7XBA9_9BACT|nr:helix-turn-helix domain-containing protein [Lacipirellula parvula]BBO33645.1 hypothetical protein PLANPX_3257 [Lacipirellula parvula]
MSSAVSSESPQLLTTPREAAELLRISEKALWNLTVPRGDLQCVRLGRSVRYSLATLRKYVEQQQNAAAG